MFSFARKFLATGRTTTAQPLSGSDASVRKYSLTSTQDPPAPISGKSFTLNPEHIFSSTTHPFSLGGGGGMNGSPVEGDGALRTGGFNMNTLESTVNITRSNLDVSEGSSNFEYSNSQPNRGGLLRENSRNHSVESLTHTPETTSISNVDSQLSLYGESERLSQFSSRKTERRLLHSSEEKISESHHTSRCSSNSDEILDSITTISDVPAISAISLNVQEAPTKFLRARRKQRELKSRRKTLDVFNFSDGESNGGGKISWSQSKFTTPLPTNPELGHVDLRLIMRSTSGSNGRRHTMGGSIDDSDVVSSPVDEVLGGRIGGPWSSVYSSSDDLVSEFSRVDQRGGGAVSGVKRGLGLRRGSLCAVAISVGEMRGCKVIADLDLLEEDTEFEPCAVPFENTVVLWPAAVDKPSCFESSRFSRSWISNLEATGFVGSQCLLMAPVTLSRGLHEYTQLLFLFPSHLVFAEQKSYSLLKVDQKVSTGDIWLSARKEDVAEVLESAADSPLDGSRSLVLGWPLTTNAVVTFCTSEEKAAWIARIEELIEVENAKDKDPDRRLVIKIVHKERGHTRLRELSVAKSENSFQVLQRCLLDFHLETTGSRDFQLFVKWGKDQPLQPLLGHEFPFIFETWFQTLVPRKDSSHGYCFVLRERKRTKLSPRDTIGRRRTTKGPLRTLFKWSQHRSTRPGPPLFGSSLSDICVDNSMPTHIQTLLRYLYEHGPSTDGVFRKPGGHKEVSDFKQHVSSTDEINFDDVSVHVVAAVVKEWLRRLPDCLLSSDLYLQWMEVSKLSEADLVNEELRRLSSALPVSNLLVLRHLMCVLHRVQLHSAQNRMTPFNLAVCIGPNILHAPPTADIDVQMTSIAVANAVVRLLIDAIEPVLGGADCVDLYADVADPRVIVEFEVDGSYEQNLSFDRSFAQNSTAQSLESLDSLHESPPPITEQSGQVLESMSADSGLAASNPQLYEEEEEEDPTPISSSAQPEGHYLKRLHRRSEKSEVSDISESLVALDSDSGSLSSAASERSASATVPVRMRGARNVRERVHRLRATKLNLDELVSSFDEQFAVLNSVVIAPRSEDETSTEEKRVTVLEVCRSGEEYTESGEETGIGHGDDEKSRAVLELRKENKRVAVESDTGDTLTNLPAEPVTSKLQEGLSESLRKVEERKRVAKVDSAATVKPSEEEEEVSGNGERVTSRFQLTSIEILTSQSRDDRHLKDQPLHDRHLKDQPRDDRHLKDQQIVSTDGDDDRTSQERPIASSSVVKNWVEKLESTTHPKKAVMMNPSHEENINSSASQSRALLGSPRKQKKKVDSTPLVSPSQADLVTQKPSEDLPQTSKKVERLGSVRKSAGEAIPPLRMSSVKRERREAASNLLSCEDRGQNIELRVSNQPIDCTDSRKASVETDLRESEQVRDLTFPPESTTVSMQIELPNSGEASGCVDHRAQSTDVISVRSSPRGKVTNIELRDDRKPTRTGLPGCQEGRNIAPLLQNVRTDPSDGVSLCVCATQLNDRRKGVDRVEEIQWSGEERGPRYQPAESRLKVDLSESRLKDQPRYDRHLKDQPRDDRRLKDQLQDDRHLKDQPRDDRHLKDQLQDGRHLKDQPRDDRHLKDQPRDDRHLKDQPRDDRHLKLQSRFNRPKDQPKEFSQPRLERRLKVQSRDHRLKVQPRSIDDNWRLERVASRAPPLAVPNSESFDRVSGTGLVTSAFVRHITSEGCRVTMGSIPAGHLPRYLPPQTREPVQSREPVLNADHQSGPSARRSVTVIQMGDEDSVIVRKSVQKT